MPYPSSCWILEDEPPALRRLRKLLTEVAPGIHLSFTTDSIAPARRALNEQPPPGLIFSDIHLADGLAFELWESVTLPCPIVFTTAYDQYSIRAFRTNGVDYLLKPVDTDELRRALDKVARLRAPTDLGALLQTLRPARYRERFLVRHRQDYLPVSVRDLRQFFSQDGLTFALAGNGHRYLLEEPLDRLQEQLDPACWFRINRAQIVHVEAVQRISPYFNHRLSLQLQPAGEGENVVSRGKVGEFREWVGGSP